MNNRIYLHYFTTSTASALKSVSLHPEQQQDYARQPYPRSAPPQHGRNSLCLHEAGAEAASRPLASAIPLPGQRQATPRFP